MAIPGVITSQTGGRTFDAPDMTKYSMFVGEIGRASCRERVS